MTAEPIGAPGADDMPALRQLHPAWQIGSNWITKASAGDSRLITAQRGVITLTAFSCTAMHVRITEEEARQEREDPWAALSHDDALSRVRKSIHPGWEAWTVGTTDEGLIWCARRFRDGALAHGDTPARLLAHCADADTDAYTGEAGR